MLQSALIVNAKVDRKTQRNHEKSWQNVEKINFKILKKNPKKLKN